MVNPADDATPIRVAGLNKVYKEYWGPRSLFREMFLGTPSHHPFRALQDVTFEVSRGESFGLVGNNGAGKSTLLKILSGTTFPTDGKVEVDGKVSALLELGTGFHPEFTGRQNIYFSGALAGLDKTEVQEREAEIIEFTELESFIDKPVKTYSTGMYVRLGFAVATGFDPDILIVDEALAVGDQRFQKKCTDRIHSFRKQGTTILFCSHNLHQVKALCDRAIWLHEGRVNALGGVSQVVDQYNDFCRQDGTLEVPGEAPALSEPRGNVCWIESVRLRNRKTEDVPSFRNGETIALEVAAHFSPQFQGKPGIVVVIVRNDGVPIYTTASTIDGFDLVEGEPGSFRACLVLPDIPLLSGRYHFNVITTDESNLQAYDIREGLEPFSISDEGLDSGVIRLKHHWEGPAE